MDEPGIPKQEEEGGSDAPWLATYADMMTLLFCFFVLMFAISNVDAQKFAMLAAAFSKDGITPEIMVTIQDMYPGDGEYDYNKDEFLVKPPLTETEPPEETSPTTETGPIEDETQPIRDGPGGGEGLGDLYFALNQYIELNGMEESVVVEYAGTEVLITLKNDIWFQSGSAEVTADMRESGIMLGKLLLDNQDESNPFNIIVVGHTDNRPISNAKYPNNWYLSVQRAVEFQSILLEETSLDPYYFSVRGCGDTRPIGDNKTEEGQQQNRRVEIYISYFNTMN